MNNPISGEPLSNKSERPSTVAYISIAELDRPMDQSEKYAFVDFEIANEAACDRLEIVTAELQKQKTLVGNREEEFWLTYFSDADRAEFWWPTEAEMECWNRFWFSTPLPGRHSPEMPVTPWDFGSMIDAIMNGEYDLIGIRKLDLERARLEIDPHAYPYGGIDAVRALVRSFGHRITGFDDGAVYTDSDPQSPRWSKDMPPFELKKQSRL